MRKNLGPKSLCYPMPVFIVATYNEDGTENAMTAAWGGITEENEITVCIDNIHKTAINLPQRNAFTVAMATAETLTDLYANVPYAVQDGMVKVSLDVGEGAVLTLPKK